MILVARVGVRISDAFLRAAVFIFIRASGLSLYWLLGEGRAQRLFILLLASILFYGWSELVFILVVFASLALDLFVAQKSVACQLRVLTASLG